jgi:hypothetical protein
LCKIRRRLTKELSFRTTGTGTEVSTELSFSISNFTPFEILAVFLLLCAHDFLLCSNRVSDHISHYIPVSPSSVVQKQASTAFPYLKTQWRSPTVEHKTLYHLQILPLKVKRRIRTNINLLLTWSKHQHQHLLRTQRKQKCH